MVADIDLLVVQEHTVDSLDSGLGSLSSLVVDKPVALGAAVLIRGDLAGEYVPEGSEGIVESLKTRMRMMQSDRPGVCAPCCRSARPSS